MVVDRGMRGTIRRPPEGGRIFISTQEDKKMNQNNQQLRRVSSSQIHQADIMVAQEQLRRAEAYRDDCGRAAAGAVNVWAGNRRELMRLIDEDADTALIESGVQACATSETSMWIADDKWREAILSVDRARAKLRRFEQDITGSAPVEPKPKRKGWFKRALRWTHREMRQPFTGYQLVAWHTLWVTLTLIMFKLIGALG